MRILKVVILLFSLTFGISLIGSILVYRTNADAAIEASGFSPGDSVILKLDGTKGMVVWIKYIGGKAVVRVRVSTPGHPVRDFSAFELEKTEVSTKEADEADK